MFVRSSDGKRITEMKSCSVMSPENDLKDEDVWKVFINGATYGRYSNELVAMNVMEDIIKSLKDGVIVYEMNKDS